MLRRKKQLIRALVLPVGLAVAFAAYLASEILLRGRWISHVIYEGDWTEGARVASFAIAAVLIWLVGLIAAIAFLQIGNNLCEIVTRGMM